MNHVTRALLMYILTTLGIAPAIPPDQAENAMTPLKVTVMIHPEDGRSFRDLLLFAIHDDEPHVLTVGADNVARLEVERADRDTTLTMALSAAMLDERKGARGFGDLVDPHRLLRHQTPRKLWTREYHCHQLDHRFNPSLEVSIPGTDRALTINLYLQRATNVTGLVINEVTEKPVESCRVMSRAGPAMLIGNTAADGRFITRGLDPHAPDELFFRKDPVVAAVRVPDIDGPGVSNIGDVPIRATYNYQADFPRLIDFARHEGRSVKDIPISVINRIEAERKIPWWSRSRSAGVTLISLNGRQIYTLAGPDSKVAAVYQGDHPEVDWPRLPFGTYYAVQGSFEATMLQLAVLDLARNGRDLAALGFPTLKITEGEPQRPLVIDALKTTELITTVLRDEGIHYARGFPTKAQ